MSSAPPLAPPTPPAAPNAPNAAGVPGDLALRDADFRRLRACAYALCGIDLPPGKEGLVRSRLARRVRALGLPSYAAYVDLVESDAGADERVQMVDALTTNKTSFFREPQHFAVLRDLVLPPLVERGRVRIWSAGCSTGEEPYTLAMVLRESCPVLAHVDARVLATDVSTRVLAHARQGVYDETTVAAVPPAMRARHFVPMRPTAPRTYRASAGLRELVRFARLNLVGPWPMQGPFDVIFCRNVMIYFDRPTRHRLLARFRDLLAPGGHLFVGHAESLTTIPHRFRYVQPAVYAR